jgi:hypothetical protein
LVDFADKSREPSQKEGQLAFEQAENSPWLNVNNQDPTEGSIDPRRILAISVSLFGLGSLFAGAFWYYSNFLMAEKITADGGLIEAPSLPYKERPAFPGGKQFSGTGDVAPGVSEGLVTRGQLAPSVMSPENSIGSVSGSTMDIAGYSENTVFAVQLGAYETSQKASESWQELKRKTEKLAGLPHRVVVGSADMGIVYRLQAVLGDRSEARQLCAALEEDGLSCIVKQ